MSKRGAHRSGRPLPPRARAAPLAAAPAPAAAACPSRVERNAPRCVAPGGARLRGRARGKRQGLGKRSWGSAGQLRAAWSQAGHLKVSVSGFHREEVGERLESGVQRSVGGRSSQRETAPAPRPRAGRRGPRAGEATASVPDLLTTGTEAEVGMAVAEAARLLLGARGGRGFVRGETSPA